MLSKAIGQHRFSGRADWFDTDQVQIELAARVRGIRRCAWTVGYSYERDQHWSFAIEALRIKSDVSMRACIGEPTRATEKQLQLQVRYSL